MNKHVLFAAMAGGLCGLVINSAWGQEVAQLRDDQLLTAVAEATEAEDGDRLLELMLEAKARGLLMFPEVKVCEIDYPDTEFFANEFYRGAISWAYDTEVREIAIKKNYCGCPYDLLSFDQFTNSMVGKSPKELLEADYKLIRKHKRDLWTPVQKAHQQFRKEICGVDPWQ